MIEIDVALQGLLAGAALIVAIGAQNAFVLRQGVRREHVLPVVLLCVAADALLMSVGAAGLGVAVERLPWLVTVTRLGGALFLLGYAVLAARRALRPASFDPADDTPASRRVVLLTAAALTFLNPHVYLDGVVLIGGLANQHGADRWSFVAGSLAASVLWFAALGLAAHRLAGLLSRPLTWRVLDVVVALTMAGLGLRLLLG